MALPDNRPAVCAMLCRTQVARLTAPGIGMDAGCVPGETLRLMFQGEHKSAFSCAFECRHEAVGTCSCCSLSALSE